MIKALKVLGITAQFNACKEFAIKENYNINDLGNLDKKLPVQAVVVREPGTVKKIYKDFIDVPLEASGKPDSIKVYSQEFISKLESEGFSVKVFGESRFNVALIWKPKVKGLEIKTGVNEEIRGVIEILPVENPEIKVEENQGEEKKKGKKNIKKASDNG